MKKKRRRTHKPRGEPGDVLAELGLNPDEWVISAGYSKGILSGSRYTRVTVCHRPSSREKSESFYATGKAAARRDAVALARRLVQELRRA
jgi:hypothetical protein